MTLNRLLPTFTLTTTVAALMLVAGARQARAQTYTPVTIATFNGTNGANPEDGVTFDSSGDIFGTSSTGGANGDGTVFEIPVGTNTIDTIATFNGTNGANPYASLTFDSRGDIFGSTYNGGTNNDGTVFEIAAGTSTLTTLVSFTFESGGNRVSGVTLDNSGNIYVTTQSPNAVYEIPADSHTLTTIADLSAAQGEFPEAGVTLDSSGNIYSSAETGGDGYGTIFKLAAGTRTITTLVSFTFFDGAYPWGNLVIDSQGNLYGTTENGGVNDEGTVFEVAAGTNAMTTLANFSLSTGRTRTGLTLGAGGNLYGTAYNGLYDDGEVFELALGSGTLTTLATFNGAGDGEAPVGTVTFGNDGNLYGTTVGGGADGDGTVYELEPTAPEPTASALLLSAGAPVALGGFMRRRKRYRKKW